MAVNNIELYEFLRETENHMYFSKKEQVVRAWAWIPFYKLEDFAKAIGDYHFYDGGLEVKMFFDGISIELNEIFESEDEFLWEYRACFEKSEFDKYKDELQKEYQEGK